MQLFFIRAMDKNIEYETELKLRRVNFFIASKHISSKTEQRAYIKLLTNLGAKPIQIHEDLVTVYHGEALAYPTVKEWAHELRAGRGSIEDALGSEDRFPIPPLKLPLKFWNFLDIDPHLSVEEIALILDFSSGNVHTILPIISNIERFQRDGYQKSSQKGKGEEVS
ncbi:hypothetical protein LOD99_9990 [Oopsacas minuta]|uniref:Uncharacterized protein n=1 Tax=Oopsacas minuta TaxID=111878 RepID=A0AAV7KK21_9METZ|nr:hypothetical protein LOD99_9990 [Oopsacas minuta]